MFFLMSKLFWLVAQPVSIISGLVLLGLVCVYLRWHRRAMAALLLALLVAGLSSYTTLGYLLIAPLEDRFAVPVQRPERVAAIIMLGGATDSHVSATRQTVALNGAGERLTTTLELAGAFPQAKILLSGGGGALSRDGESEAETARRFFVAQGIAPDRLVLEGHSRNTIENAAFSRDLVAGADEPAILVTSAFHMPRSVALFRRQGIAVLAWPTDFRSKGNEAFGLSLADPVENLSVTSTAMREWIGLVAYRLAGQIDELFPAP